MEQAQAKRVRIPYLYEPRPYQLPIFQSQSRYKVVVMHRKSGKSKTILNQQILRAMQKPGLYLYLLPTYKQAKKVIWLDPEMMKHFPPEAIVKKNDTELYIKFVNGSLWLLGGADEPSSWRGTNPIDAVLDEYSEMKEEIWTEFLRPVFTNNKGTVTFVFTPKGKNHAHKIFLHAKDNKGPMWDWWHLGVKETQAISDEELQEARRDMPEALYKQEMECEFLEGAGAVFRRIRENTWDGNLQVLPGKLFTLGVDLAKYQDWTVLTPFDRNSFRVGMQERFNQVDWNLQKARIEAAGRRLNNARIRIDSTGVGDPIFEDLRKQGLNIEEFKFTEDSRRRLLENLVIMLEQDKVKIPNDPGLLEELGAATYEMSETTRKIRIGWPNGVPDDRVMSLALAVWEAGEPIPHASVRPRSSEFARDSAELERAQTSRFHY